MVQVFLGLTTEINRFLCSCDPNPMHLGINVDDNDGLTSQIQYNYHNKFMDLNDIGISDLRSLNIIHCFSDFSDTPRNCQFDHVQLTIEFLRLLHHLRPVDCFQSRYTIPDPLAISLWSCQYITGILKFQMRHTIVCVDISTSATVRVKNDLVVQ